MDETCEPSVIDRIQDNRDAIADGLRPVDRVVLVHLSYSSLLFLLAPRECPLKP